MDDRQAQFLFVVADACVGAELAQLNVEVLTSDGVRYRGVPTAVEVDQPDAVDGGARFRVGKSVIALEDVVEFLVWPPGDTQDPSPTLNDR